MPTCKHLKFFFFNLKKNVYIPLPPVGGKGVSKICRRQVPCTKRFFGTSLAIFKESALSIVTFFFRGCFLRPSCATPIYQQFLFLFPRKEHDCNSNWRLSIKKKTPFNAIFPLLNKLRLILDTACFMQSAFLSQILSATRN